MSRIGKRLYVMASVLACGSALAQTYPAKPVRIVAAKLSAALGQQFIVENRVGAGSTIGTAAAARAAPDGHTLLVVLTVMRRIRIFLKISTTTRSTILRRCRRLPAAPW